VRSRAVAYVLLLLGGGLALVASGQPWWRAVGTGLSVRFTGTEASGGLSQALGVVALAGTLLTLALRRRGRQVVAIVLLATAAGAVLAGLLRLRPSADAVRTGVREVSLADSFEVLPTGWPWVYAAAGLLLGAGALLVLLSAPGWAGGAKRFDRTASASPAVSAADDPADVWKAMDAGQDPTATTADDPDVHQAATTATMDVSGNPARSSPSDPGQAPDSRRR